MNNGTERGKLGVLVGGGPAPGINGVIAAATIAGINEGFEVIGFRDGFKWLAAGDTQHYTKLTIDDVKSIHLRGGSILFSSSDRIEGHGRGYLTSATWSAVLEKHIALGLYQGGLEHIGEEIICAYPLKGERTRARIVSPLFIDPHGERLRA